MLLLLLATAAVAQEGDDERFFEVPPTLPEGITGVVRPGSNARPDRIDRIRDVFLTVRACWQPPRAGGFSGQELTLRLSFKRSGELLGQPRITYYKAGTVPDQREPFTRSVREAFVRCTPLPVTESLGRAIAGRIFTFRFIDAQPM